MAVVLLLTALLVATSVSTGGEHLLVCEHGPDNDCRPLVFTDPPLLITLIIVGLLLLPDVSTLRIAGLFEIERAVAETNKEIASARQDVAMLQQQITSAIAVRADARVTSTHNINLLASGQAANLDEASIEGKAANLDDL